MKKNKKTNDDRKTRLPHLHSLRKLSKKELQELGQQSLFRAQQDNPQLFSLSKILYRVAWATFACVFGSFFLFAYLFNDAIKRNIEVMPYAGFGILIVMISFPLAGVPLIWTFSFFNGFKSNPINLILDPLLVPRWQKSAAVFSLISIVCSIGALFYISGAVKAIFTFLNTVVFPSAGSFLNYVLANIVGWILSGVIGNFVYDMLKKITSRKAITDQKPAEQAKK